MSTKLLKKFLQQTSATLDAATDRNGDNASFSQERSGRIRREARARLPTISTSKDGAPMTAKDRQVRLLQKQANEMLRFDRMAGKGRATAEKALNKRLREQQKEKNTKKRIRLMVEDCGRGVGNSRSSSSRTAQRKPEPTCTKATRAAKKRREEANSLKRLEKLLNRSKGMSAKS